MKNLIIVCLCILPFLGIAQVDETATTKRFTSKDKMYNDWSIYAFGGTSLIQTGDLTSIKNGVGDWNFGYDFQFGVEKAINHAVGIIFQYHMGKTKQEYVGNWYGAGQGLVGETEYQGFMLLGDINLTSLFRRFDNHSPYKWGLHSYIGAGVIGYKAKSNAFNNGLGLPLNEIVVVDDETAGLGSFYSTLGLGLKYRVSRRIDIEAKGMYYFTGDEEFDGSGDPVFVGGVHRYSPADIEEQRHDNFVTFSLGLNLKLGKHDRHLFWVPFWPEPVPPPQPLCETGDEDQDGVCDDWDKCLDTPLGARIDGSGCALDTDLDGIIDLHDRCITEPGTPELQGCPEVTEDVFGDLAAEFEGIEFALDSDELRPISFPILDNAAMLIQKYGKDMTFLVEGHTDTRGSEEYNLDLSQRRVQRVVDYMVSKGVPASQLVPRGVGESDLLYPECADAEKCKREGKEWLNEANRRVVFKVLDAGAVNNVEEGNSNLNVN